MHCPVSSSLIFQPSRIKATSKVYAKKKLTKNLRNPRRTKLPPEFGVNLFLRKPITEPLLPLQEEEPEEELDVWEPNEIEAISSLFQQRIPQKPEKPLRVRPLPLPQPHKLRPLSLPTPKPNNLKKPLVPSSSKDPTFLITLARDIKRLPSPEADVSLVLN